MLLFKTPLWSQKISLKNSHTKYAGLYVCTGLSFVITVTNRISKTAKSD